LFKSIVDESVTTGYKAADNMYKGAQKRVEEENNKNQ
jgi:hypothetical protein